MAHLYRLIFSVLLLFSGGAHAVIPAVTMYGYAESPYNVASVGFPYSSKAAACAAFTTAYRAGSGTTATFTVSGERCFNSGIGGYNISTNPASCPANSTSVTGGCQCATGYQENGGKTACEVPPSDCVALAGKPAGGKSWNGTASDYFFCDGYNATGNGKCVVKATRSVSVESPPGSGKWISSGEGVYTGSTASSCSGAGGDGGTPANDSTPPGSTPPDAPKAGEAAPAPCPAGQQPGTVNGTRVCAPVGPDQPTEAPAPGTGSKEVKNPDGTTTTTTTSGTTKCASGNCTTTTTTTVTIKNAAGTVTDTKSTDTKATESQAGFCTANPKVTQCTGVGDGNGSGFSGDCAAGFKADSDDAVIAAMALEQHKRDCELFVTKTDESNLYDVEKVKSGNRTTDLPGNASVAIGAGDIDMSNALGGGSCFNDKTYNVHGYSFTMKVSLICPYAEQLGNLLVAIALLTAAGIVYKRSD